MSVQRITKLPSLPTRPDDAHKGTCGRVLMIAGSRGMSGAACLAGLGALRGGAGLVFVAAPTGIIPAVASVEPSYLTVHLPEDHDGCISKDAQANLDATISNNDVVAVGPGLGRSTDLTSLVEWLYTSVDLPMVVDADALNALADIPEVLSNHPAPRILTPHPGEFSRLIGQDISIIQQHRENLAAEFAEQHDIVLLLKGHETIITDGQQLAINTTGNSGMATGGTGDVLTGLIAALLGQGLSAFEAAQLGAHLHGLAGDLAAEEISKPALIASDLPNYLGKAWKQLASRIV